MSEGAPPRLGFTLLPPPPPLPGYRSSSVRLFPTRVKVNTPRWRPPASAQKPGEGWEWEWEWEAEVGGGEAQLL